MKKFNLRGVLDNIRSSVSASPKPDIIDVEESLHSGHFQVAKTVRHGFPFQPTAMSFDPVQNLLAIGTKSGSIRIFGRPGVECHMRHEGDVAILQIIFLVNEGALISVTSDDNIHLWNIRQKTPGKVHSLKFQRERVTYCYLAFQSRWLFVGTERGNVHTINVETFTLSGYLINWNKAIELSRKTHPGSVVHLSECPVDPNKLLIGFETGSIVLWDLRSKTAECRYQYHEPLKSCAWHHEGKQFMCSHGDGSLITWNSKTPQKPTSILTPHARGGSGGKDGKTECCRPIMKVEWKAVRDGEPFVIFSGGMAHDKTCHNTRSLTVVHAKSTTVLEMEHHIVDFIALCPTPWNNDFQDPYGIVVLLQNDLVVVDLTTQGYPCFENPYPMDIHESPVTSCAYYADCPPDLIPAFYSVGSRQKKTGFSEKEWPIRGGEWGQTTCSYPEIIITGHADGSLKFWDASAVTLQVLYKFKTAKLFDRSRCHDPDPDDDPFAIQHIYLDPESRYLAVAGFTHVILAKFSKQEATLEVPTVDVTIVYEIFDEVESPEIEFPPQPSMNKINIANAHQGSSCGSYSSNTSDSKNEKETCLQVKQGARRWSSGYQPEMVCVLSWVDGQSPPPISDLSINVKYGLLAFGNECGLAAVDMIQRTCLLNLGTPDLYGSMDPYSRAPRSPRHKNPTHHGGVPGSRTSYISDNHSAAPALDECKSPTGDQNDGCSRSRSSSVSSLENINKEAITCLSFSDSYTRKFDNFTCPCLWVGTSLGSVLVVVLSLPPEGEQRRTQPVIVSPSGTIFRLKGSILAMSFLDCNGVLIPSESEGWSEKCFPQSSANSTSTSTTADKKYSRQQSVSSLKMKTSPVTTSQSENASSDRQFAIICSEKQARVVSLPSQTCAYKQRITESSFVTTASVVSLKDSVCLCCFTASGHIMVFSLPSLKPLLDIPYMSQTDMRIARTFCFSNNGHAMSFCSPTELQKITFSADTADSLKEMLGDLFLPCDNPEAPKQSFFKNLFTGGPSTIDREELFGENSGKPFKGVARYSAGTAAMSSAMVQGAAANSEIGRAKMAALERGERLGQLEDRTEAMRAEAENYARQTHELMIKYKYKSKKWYQF